MKKSGAIIRIIIWSLTAIALTSILVVVIALGDSVKLDKYSIGVFSYTYKNPDSYSVGSCSLSDNITSIEVNWTSGKINIEPYEGNTVEITETDMNEEKWRLRYKVEGTKLIIHPKESGWLVGLPLKEPVKTLNIKIPKVMAEDFNNIEIDSVSADIEINGITVLKTLEVDNTSGKIDCKNLKAKSVEINTTSGDVNIEGSINHLDSDSVSGKINIKSDILINELECDSTSGDITVSIPDGNFKAEFDSVSGDFNTDFPQKKKGNTYICGDGSAEFEVDTTSGDFTVKELKKK